MRYFMAVDEVHCILHSDMLFKTLRQAPQFVFCAGKVDILSTGVLDCFFQANFSTTRVTNVE